jgi:hypothetical protein
VWRRLVHFCSVFGAGFSPVSSAVVGCAAETNWEELEGKGGARRFTSLCVANPDVVRWQVLTDYEVNEGV